ncbi:MAG TPA: type II toxin-antitoxin system RelE/ParE family toxin [Candidatus Saccharimonadia bacterium]
MASVKWLPEALDDVERLYYFLRDKSPQAAMRAANSILQGAILLKATPRLGRPMDDATGRRELFISFGAGAYVLRYMLEKKDVVIVICVWHSREDKPASD